MKTLSTRFNQLREEAGLTLEDLSRATGMSQSAIWKIENDRLIKGDTLHNAIVYGLGFPVNSREYRELISLWVESQGLAPPNIRKTKEIDWISKVSRRDLIALQKSMEDDKSRDILLALARHLAKSP